MACGGAEKVLVDLLDHMDLVEYDITLVLFSDRIEHRPACLAPHKIKILHKRYCWDFFRLIVELRAIVNEVRPATVISLLDYAHIITGLVKKISKHAFRTVFWEHSYPPKYYRAMRWAFLKTILIKYTYSRADHIITVSDPAATALREWLQLQPQKITCIANPVSIDTIKDRANAAIPVDRDKNRFILVSVGRLEPEKRYDRLLRVFALVLEQSIPAELWMLGDGSLKENLQRQAEGSGLSDHVTFWGFQNNPYAYLARSDVFIMTSDYEGLPLSMLEAMALGLPVITTDFTGVSAIMKNGESGYILPADDEKAMAQKVIELCRNKDRRTAMSRAAMERAMDFNIDQMMPKYENIFCGRTPL